MALQALVVSALFILLTLVLAHTARYLVDTYLTGNERAFIRVLFHEGIAAAELCGCCFELIIVADNFGVSTYAIFLFLLTIWWSQVWTSAAACPYIHLENVVKGDMLPRQAALIVWAELTGGILIFRYVQLYWSLELVDTHVDRAFQNCKADLQVPMLYGCIIEAVATCMCRLASKTLSEMEPRFGVAIDSFVGTSLVVAAFDYSGGYFNPVLATSLKYGCHGNTFIEHIVVYWIGACSGSLLSVFIYDHPKFREMVFGPSRYTKVE